MTYTNARLLTAVLPLSLLAACADMSNSGKLMPAANTMPYVESFNGGAVASFIAAQRVEAHRLDAGGNLAGARLHWRYVAALTPGDAEVTREIARLDAAIRQRVAALTAQGETALAANRTAEAQLDFLKVLALDGSDQRARNRLRDLDTRTELAAQDRKDKMARAAMSSGTESPGDEQAP